MSSPLTLTERRCPPVDQTATQQNPLGREEIPKLLSGFAVPSIIAMLVGR